MNYPPLIRLSLLALALIIISAGCFPQKKIVYFQSNKEQTDSLVTINNNYLPTIQSNDVLNIFVTSINAEVSKLFNFVDNPNNEQNSNGYLVDVTGKVNLPLVGSVKVVGLSTAQARDSITKALEKYVQSPTVRINIRNFRVSVLGEVSRPGYFEVQNERFTLAEALARCGDLTMYGKRDDVMIIRDVNGQKQFMKFDLTNRELFRSENFLLHNNDIVYVTPIKQKKFLVQTYHRLLPLIFSGLSLSYVIYRAIDGGNL